MTIDQIIINLYTCCKCFHTWTNWDSKNKKDGRLPLNCPKCRNVRWNQKYTKEDLVLVERLIEQHMIKKNVGTRKVLSREDFGITTWYPGTYYIKKVNLFDFMAYHFLYSILPRPEIFEGGSSTSEVNSLKKAIEAGDPSLARSVEKDPSLNWLCKDYPYLIECKRIQQAAAMAA